MRYHQPQIVFPKISDATRQVAICYRQGDPQHLNAKCNHRKIDEFIVDVRHEKGIVWLRFSQKKTTQENLGSFYLSSCTANNSGVGGNRTLVHTSNRKVFYMFSFHLVFENALTENRPHTP